MEYLTRWRMLLAGDRLTSSTEPILSIALSLGYESESSFGKAFKRVMGSPPRRYSRQRDLHGAGTKKRAQMELTSQSTVENARR